MGNNYLRYLLSHRHDQRKKTATGGAAHCMHSGRFALKKKNVLSVRAVTRQETTAAVVDVDLFAEKLLRTNYSDSHAAVCREVRSCTRPAA